MVDDCSVMEQFREPKKILNQFKQYDMKIDETIVVSSLIDKLPPSWKDFKRSLKHKKDDISLKALATSLRIEENFRKQEQNRMQILMVPKSLLWRKARKVRLPRKSSSKRMMTSSRRKGIRISLASIVESLVTLKRSVDY